MRTGAAGLKFWSDHFGKIYFIETGVTAQPCLDECPQTTFGNIASISRRTPTTAGDYMVYRTGISEIPRFDFLDSDANVKVSRLPVSQTSRGSNRLIK